MSGDAIKWRKSSSSAIGDCVAVARLEDGSIAVRNTNDPEARVLVVGARAMADWVACSKAGELDDLV